MGCDYYIAKVLQIEYYTNTDVSEIEVSRERGYYNIEGYNYDEDEDDYEEKVNMYIKNQLTPQMKPIILFSNSMFNKRTSEEKYSALIEDELKKCDSTWCDIKLIRKIEKRYQN
jgi:c-di-AMP phosphodiesterase-like protein